MSVPGLGDGLPVELVSQGAHGCAPSVPASWPPWETGKRYCAGVPLRTHTDGGPVGFNLTDACGLPQQCH